MVKILFVEDDDKYRESMTKILEDEGYIVDAAENVLKAIEYFSFNTYDLIISDLMMEGVDGLQFLTYVRKMNPEIKTMILTAEPSMDSEYAALDIYVDKYIVKETRMDVFLKHIEVLLTQSFKRAKTEHLLESKSDGIIMDLYGHTVTKNNKRISVTPKEFNLVRFLLENKGKALSREEILEKVWVIEYEDVEVRVVDVHIKSIRKKLNITSIISIRGYGYKWDR
jgi:Response regulators consisting of a CheY-like receiver domain and a winged-helix DNA-binding domain